MSKNNIKNSCGRLFYWLSISVPDPDGSYSNHQLDPDPYSI